jgi:hypothetical protein
MKTRIVLVVTMMTLTGGGLAACTPDPLDITCAEYSGLGQDEQLDLAARWGSPSRDHIDEMAKMVAASLRNDLLNYCRTHSDDKLKDLHFG